MKKVVLKYFCLCLLSVLLCCAGSPAFAGQQVNLNQATYEQLVTLKGIGEKTAQKIIEYRQLNGDFASVDEIVNVKGIGVKKLASLRDELTVAESQIQE